MTNLSGFRLEDVCIKVEHQESRYIAVVEHWWTEHVLGRGEDETEYGAIGRAILAVRDTPSAPPSSLQLQMAFETAK